MGLRPRPGTICATAILGLVLLLCLSSERLKVSWFDAFERKTKDHGALNVDGNLQGTGKLWESISAAMFENPGKGKKQPTTSKTTKGSMIRNYLLFIALMLSGDISTNPGPVANPCSVCFGPVARNHKAILCDCCAKYVHIRCEGGISNKAYKIMTDREEFPFICRTCLAMKHPFNELEDSEFFHTFGIDNMALIEMKILQ